VPERSNKLIKKNPTKQGNNYCVTHLYEASIMKKTIQRLMLTVMLTSAFRISVKAVDCPTKCPTTKGRYTNKTFLMPRPHGVDLPMEMTTFHRFHHNNKDKALDNLGATLQLTGFYSDSRCSDGLGAYFGIKHKSSFPLSGAATNNNTLIKQEDQKDLDLFYIIHNQGRNADEAKDDVGTSSICLKPEHKAYGFRFDVYRNLDRITPGLFFKANLPIVHVKNHTRLRASSTGENIIEGLGTKINDYFKGKFTGIAAAGNKQDKLEFAKHDCANINTGVADIDLALGYNFFYKNDYSLGLAGAITIPTGNKPKGEHVFEAIYGNGHHFAIGADLYGHYNIWGDSNHNVIFNIAGKYRYLFESQEKRTLGLKRPSATTTTDCAKTSGCTTIDWGHYYLLGDTQKDQLVPAANILTQYVGVTPGSHFDGIASLQYNFKGLVLDLGYNFFFKEKEAVRLRKKLEENRYAIAGRNYVTADGTNFTITDANVDGNDTQAATISTNSLRTNQIQITTCMAETPQQITHGIFGGLGYVFNQAKFPVMLGLGGKYEFKDNNAAIEKWTVWGKIGVNF